MYKFLVLFELVYLTAVIGESQNQCVSLFETIQLAVQFTPMWAVDHVVHLIIYTRPLIH